MKKFVWFFGVALLLSFFMPPNAGVKPVTPVVDPTVNTEIDPTISRLLANASREDRAVVAGIYSGLKRVMTRDKGVQVNNTEKWATLQANTLALAVTQVNKYPGLDVAIDNVFRTQVGTDDVMPSNPDVAAKLIKACEIIVNSAAYK